MKRVPMSLNRQVKLKTRTKASLGPVGFLDMKRRRYKVNSRRALYDAIEAGAKVVRHMEKNPRALQRLLRRAFFKKMHVRPAEAHKAVMQYEMDATTRIERQQANSYGRAIHFLLGSGMSVKEIGDHLARSGGLDATLKKAKQLIAGVEADLGTDLALPVQERKAAVPTIEVAAKCNDDQGTEPETHKHVDNTHDQHVSSRGRAADGKMILEVTCTVKALRALLASREALLRVQVEQIGAAEDWQSVELTRYRILG